MNVYHRLDSYACELTGFNLVDGGWGGCFSLQKKKNTAYKIVKNTVTVIGVISPLRLHS